MRKTLEKRLDTTGGVSARAGRRIEVVELALVEAVPPEYSDGIVPETGRPAYPWSHEGGGFLVASARLRNEDLREASRYSMETHIATIFTQATRIDADDPQELLALCNQWGVLGCCEPDMPRLHIDSVLRCSCFLKRLGRLARWLEAMQNERWNSPGLSRRSEITKEGRRGKTSGKLPSQRDRLRIAFAQELNDLVWQIPLRPALYLARKRFEPVLEPRCLKEALAIELWQRATDSRLGLRQCRGCGGLFRVARSNSKKRFCEEHCRRASQQRNYYAKNRRKIAQQRKERRIRSSGRH